MLDSDGKTFLSFHQAGNLSVVLFNLSEYDRQGFGAVMENRTKKITLFTAPREAGRAKSKTGEKTYEGVVWSVGAGVRASGSSKE